jgi:hypothetical protein
MFKEELTTLLPHFTSPTLCLSRTACPTKPNVGIADRSSRPRKRGTLHNQDAGEVGRTSTNYES